MPRFALPFALLCLISAFLSPAATADEDPAVVGRFGPLIKTEVLPIHVVLLPTGKILYWDRHDQGTHDIIPRVWDPAANTTIKTPNPGYDLFCSGHSILRNGDVLIAGGHIVDGTGEDKMRIYNYKTNTWDAGIGPMNDGRWYPTNTTLPNGDVLITSGSTETDVGNEMPQIYQYRTRTLRNLDSALLEVGLYPVMHVITYNKVFLAGPDSLTRFLDLRGRGKWIDVGFTNLRKVRSYGSSVLYAPGKIMICGGAKFPPSASVELIDANAASPKWVYSDSMHYARRHHTAVMLPDGKVMVTGGTSGEGFNNATGAVYASEMWDPATGHWTVMASAKSARLYHSFSLLLPDGRLLTGGGGHPGDDIDFLSEHPDFEIYEPPYLFRGTRPVIDAAPDTLYYGQSFHITTASVGDMHVTLLRLAAVTHALDMNADFNRLPSQREGTDDFIVAAPEDSVVSQPGPHMLFLLDSAGTPSVAKIVFLTSPHGPASIAASGKSAVRYGFSVSGNRLRIAGLGKEAGTSCSLLTPQGGRVAELKRFSGGAGGIGETGGTDGDFRLPAQKLSGAYVVVVRTKSGKHTGKIFIP
ncbi:MAG: Kelch domain protein [Fibrobacteres bacterium]|nr:Kelch domain protein [Fibrobacterota bacterium]